MKRFCLSFLFLVIFPILSFAQISDDEHKFSMQGSFQPTEVRGLPPNRFVLRWNEINNEIRGTYTDTYFATTETPVTGTVMDTGRSFNVNLNDVIRGIRTIEILTPARGLVNGSVTSTITTNNSMGMATSSYPVPVLLSADPTATEVADLADPIESCVVGMGALTGYCGKYSGTISTLSDSSGSCDPVLTQAQLELTPTGDFIYHINTNTLPTATGQNANYRHYIGSLNGNGPVSPEADVRRVHCDQLVGTRFDVTEQCLTLTLTGSFTNVAGVRGFTGTYTIQKTPAESCSLNLSLIRN